jgi:peptidoglycan/xylan/chitin deacetylase (PgdA/CDA1 family)
VRTLFLLTLLLPLACTGNQQPEATRVQSNGKEILCLVYHRFGDSRYPTTNVPVKDFEAHLSWLKKNNFKLLTFSAAIDYLNSQQPEQKIAVITIDDGYKSFFTKGFPLLKKYGLPATLFINTETVGGGDFMDWQQLETLMKNNIEIGNHTHTHAFFLNEKKETRYKTFKDEIELSQTIIAKNLKTTPVVFSYPYGEFDPEMKKIVKEAGFKAAAAQNSGIIYHGGDLFMCPRFPMSESYSAINKFSEKASSKALKVLNVSHESFVVPPDKRPLLKLTIDNRGLILKNLQCFVQGYGCQLKISAVNDSTSLVEIQSDKPMTKKRRTLYTVTVPDKKNTWHWYSHVWINSEIKDAE